METRAFVAAALLATACSTDPRPPVMIPELDQLEHRIDRLAMIADAAARLDAAQTAILVAHNNAERRRAKVAWLHATSDLHSALRRQQRVLLARRTP